MKKNNFLILLVMLLGMACPNAFAYHFVTDGIYYSVSSDRDGYYVSVTSDGPGSYIGEVVIPDNVTINRSWGSSISAGTRLRVKTIVSDAFEGCRFVTSLTVPSSVNYIGGLDNVNKTFGGLKKLIIQDYNPIYKEETLDLSRINFSTIDTIYVGRSVKIDMTNFNTSSYPDLKIEVGSKCNYFYINHSDNLCELKIYEGLKKLYVGSCNKLEELIVPNSVERGGDQFNYTNYFNKNLKTLILGKSLQTQGLNNRNGCENLTTIYDFRTAITKVSYHEFNNDNLGIQSCINEYYSFSPNLNSIIANVENPSVVFYLLDKEKFLANGEVINPCVIDDAVKFNIPNIEYSGKEIPIEFQNKVKNFDLEIDKTSLHKDVGTYTDDLVLHLKYKHFETSVNKSISYEITKAPLTVYPDNITIMYGEDIPELGYSCVGFKNNEDESVLTQKPTVITTATAQSNVGTYPIIASGGEARNYSFNYERGVLNIVKASQSISWEQDLANIMVGEKIELTASVNSDLSIEYEVSNPAIASIVYEGGKAYVVAVGEGSCTITARQKGDINHEAAMKSILLTTYQPVTITATNCSRAYGEENPVFQYTSEGGTLNGTPEISCEATKTSPVGTYPIVISKGSVTNLGDTYVNGTLTITPAPLTISAGNYTKRQGEENPQFTASYEGFKNDESNDVLTKQPTISTSVTKETAPGEYPVVISGAEAQNYSISFINGVLKVLEADAIIIKADNKTISYGDDIPELTYTVEGAELQGTPSITCDATSRSSVGTYPIIISKGSVANYNDTYVNGTLTIEKAPLTVSVGDYTRYQGEENPIFNLTYDGFRNGDGLSSLITIPQASTEATKDSPEGAYNIIISGGDAVNYYFKYVNGTLTILPTSSGIGSVYENMNIDDVTIYAPNGTRRSTLQRGINIIKMSDGTTRKVIVK